METVLAIDTAGHACSVALVCATSEIKFSKTCWMARGHAGVLASLTQAALDTLGPHQVSAIAVIRGPGGFTGMRAGLAYARAYGLARGIPTYGFDTFTALRLSVGSQTPCLIDSRRGDYFYDLTTAQILDLPKPIDGSIGILPASHLINHSQPLAGSIWQAAPEALLTQAKPKAPGWIEPDPIALAHAALAQYQNGILPDRAALSPLYVRQPSLR